jgi:hypothetical protein
MFLLRSARANAKEGRTVPQRLCRPGRVGRRGRRGGGGSTCFPCDDVIDAATLPLTAPELWLAPLKQVGRSRLLFFRIFLRPTGIVLEVYPIFPPDLTLRNLRISLSDLMQNLWKWPHRELAPRRSTERCGFMANMPGSRAASVPKARNAALADQLLWGPAIVRS